MKPLQSLSHLAIFLLLAFASSITNASVLEDACKYVAANGKDIGVSYDYCVKFFQADKGSATADKPGLASIAASIAGAAAKNATARIAALRSSEKEKDLQECLGGCADLYSDAVDALSDAAQGIASGTPGGLRDALTYLSAAVEAPIACEEVFRVINRTSVLAAENSEFTKQAIIALFVTPTPPEK